MRALTLAASPGAPTVGAWSACVRAGWPSTIGAQAAGDAESGVGSVGGASLRFACVVLDPPTARHPGAASDRTSERVLDGSGTRNAAHDALLAACRLVTPRVEALPPHTA